MLMEDKLYFFAPQGQPWESLCRRPGMCPRSAFHQVWWWRWVWSLQRCCRRPPPPPPCCSPTLRSCQPCSTDYPLWRIQEQNSSSHHQSLKKINEKSPLSIRQNLVNAKKNSGWPMYAASRKLYLFWKLNRIPALCLNTSSIKLSYKTVFFLFLWRYEITGAGMC